MQTLIRFTLLLALMSYQPSLVIAEASHESRESAHQSLALPQTPLAVFEDVWREAKANIYPIERETRFFTENNYMRLKREATRAKDLTDLADKVINPFLNQLQISHTQFYTKSHPDYYMLKSLFSTQDISTPKLHHIGMQVTKSEFGYIVRTVLEGYPANTAGIRRGDVIKSVDGQAFHPIRSFEPGCSQACGKILQISRNGRDIRALVRPVYESIHESLLRAMISSVKIVNRAGRKIGYVHLWTGTNDLILREFMRIISSEFNDVDSLILDLRDGMGGAWHSYLDPFFPDRSSFFAATWIDRLGVRTSLPVPNVPIHAHFSKPMAVLINEGVRSGKESLAYQFKKSARATLVGTTTAGAFSAGKAIFADINREYILYLAVAELLLDGTIVEGKGINPQVYVPYPLTASSWTDPQFEKALELLAPAFKSRDFGLD
jgi:carboxyl-terminal processing protease